MNKNKRNNKFEIIYKRYGAGAVQDYCNKIDHKTYAFCRQCDTDVPVLRDKSCLICGSITNKTQNVFPKKGTREYKKLTRLAFGRLKDYDKQAFNCGVLHHSVALDVPRGSRLCNIYDVDIHSKDDWGKPYTIELVRVIDNERVCESRLAWIKVKGKWRCNK